MHMHARTHTHTHTHKVICVVCQLLCKCNYSILITGYQLRTCDKQRTYVVKASQYIHTLYLQISNIPRCISFKHYKLVSGVLVVTKWQTLVHQYTPLPLLINTQHYSLFQIRNNMPLIEAADAAYQGCLPSCELHSRSLIVEHTGKVCRLRMQIMQSWDCTRVTQSPDCDHVTQSQDWLLMSLDSENAQPYLKTVQILRLRGTYSRKSLIQTCWDQRVFR